MPMSAEFKARFSRVGGLADALLPPGATLVVQTVRQCARVCACHLVFLMAYRACHPTLLAGDRPLRQSCVACMLCLVCMCVFDGTLRFVPGLRLEASTIWTMCLQRVDLLTNPCGPAWLVVKHVCCFCPTQHLIASLASDANRTGCFPFSPFFTTFGSSNICGRAGGQYAHALPRLCRR